ncbi:MAG: septation regulator SpoVG [Clostridia bacterium]|nr:septation regulator SpoVG [Clostridia bacterium]MCQ2565148.1 septation regulator SpoVG [Clostridia bacterium]
MELTDIRIRLVSKDESKLKAVASFTIDNAFVVHDVKVIEGANGNFIAMPSKQAPSGEYRDIVHPLNTETREQISSAVLAAYEQEKANSANN